MLIGYYKPDGICTVKNRDILPIFYEVQDIHSFTARIVFTDSFRTELLTRKIFSNLMQS